MQILTRPHLRSELLYDALGTSSGQKVRMEHEITSKDDPHFQIAYLKKKKSGKMSLLYQNQYTCSEDKMLG